jgi:hypothetical protein
MMDWKNPILKELFATEQDRYYANLVKAVEAAIGVGK